MPRRKKKTSSAHSTDVDKYYCPIRHVLRLLFVLSILMYLIHNYVHLHQGLESSLVSLDAPLIDSCEKKEDFSLAFNQSLGFFDDISKANWKMAQQIHTSLFPNHFSEGLQGLTTYSSEITDKGNIPKLEHSRFWYGYNFQEEFHCPLAQRLPANSEADGPKWICDPHRLKNVSDCLVYSIGSNGKVEFEQAIKDHVGEHCEIHTFDLVKYNKRNGDFAEKLKGIASFHHWGLGTDEEAKSNERMKTLEQTMDALGHTGRRIDIFKIDCEWCEWVTYKQWLSQDLRQILVETHNAPMPNAKDFFMDLHDAGYVIFSKEANYINGAGGVEYAFLKLSTDFFQDSLYRKHKYEAL